MTTYGKSKLLWLGGGVVGAVVGAGFTERGQRSPISSGILGGVLGAIIVGAFGDAVLEQEQRTGVFSLTPVSWKG